MYQCACRVLIVPTGRKLRIMQSCWHLPANSKFYTSSNPATCFGVNNCTVFNTNLRQRILSVASISSAVDALLELRCKEEELISDKGKGSCLRCKFRAFSLLYSSFPLAWRLCSMNPPKRKQFAVFCLYYIFVPFLPSWNVNKLAF